MNKLNEDFHNILKALGVAHDEAEDGGSATPAEGEETNSSAGDSTPAPDNGDSTPASDGGDSSKAPDAGNFLPWLFQH